MANIKDGMKIGIGFYITKFLLKLGGLALIIFSLYICTTLGNK